MNIFKYLKEHGIKKAIKTLYGYKIDVVIQACMKPFLKNKQLKDIITIESHNDFDCNGGALYNYLIEHNYNRRIKIVWLIKHPKMIRGKKLPQNVVWVRQYSPSIRKNYYKWISKWLCADQDCSPKLREDQISIYLTHGGGGGLKNTIGKIILPDKLDYILISSEWYLPYVAKQFSVSPDDKRLKICGFPIHDVIYKSELGDLSKICNPKSFKKVLLWMPTFRKMSNRCDSTNVPELGIPLVNTLQEYANLNLLLAQKNILLIIKLHPKQDLIDLKIYNCSNIKVLTWKDVKVLNIDNYRLMKDVDALISDYSSAAYDFLHCNKPVAYDLSDLKDYKNGLIVSDPHKLMAGNELKNLLDLEKFICDVADGKDVFYAERQILFDKMYKYHDGDSCARVVELLKI